MAENKRRGPPAQRELLCSAHKKSFKSGDDSNYSHVTSLEVSDNRVLETSVSAADCKQKAKRVALQRFLS